MIRFGSRAVTLLVAVALLLASGTSQAGKGSSRSPATGRPKTLGPHGNPRAALPPDPGGQRLIFAVFGSAKHEVPRRQIPRLQALGQAIAKGCDVTLTGACNGMPDVVRSAATAAGGLTIGISPHRTSKEHRQAGAPYQGFTVLQFTSLPFSQRNRKGPNFMGRQIDEVAQADAGIVTGGRFGTTIEALTMIEEGRPLGVLTGTGGTAKVMKHLLREAARAGKKPRAPVIFDSDPERLVRRLRAATLEQKALGIQGPIGDT